MDRMGRPWASRFLDANTAFGPGHCLLSQAEKAAPGGQEYSVLLRGMVRNVQRWVLLHPYPRRENANAPARIGFPIRPRSGHVARTQDERVAEKAVTRMNEVLARTQELEEALDDPVNLWSRLRTAWERAENEADPRMAEIVRQAREVQPYLRELEHGLRRVLRRTRELTPVDRVQEMDRASMHWLIRQPGRTTAERAGARQRILATVRHENFNTLENRVLHAYARLAEIVAREWLRDHDQAQGIRRYADVDRFRSVCRAFSRMLGGLGVGLADAGVTPNYVLMQDRSYRTVHDAWKKLLDRQRIVDDLWAWQAQTWSDFAILATVLALDGLAESELVAQSPIRWRSEAVAGRWFDQDNPLAVFWLRETGRIVEVQSRPENPGLLRTLTRAHVFLRITDPKRDDLPHRVAVWTPHAMRRIDLAVSMKEARNLLSDIQKVPAPEVLRNGLILTPAHGSAEAGTVRGRQVRVDGIAFDASGCSLGSGLKALRKFVRGAIHREAA